MHARILNRICNSLSFAQSRTLPNNKYKNHPIARRSLVVLHVSRPNAFRRYWQQCHIAPMAAFKEAVGRVLFFTSLLSWRRNTHVSKNLRSVCAILLALTLTAFQAAQAAMVNGGFELPSFAPARQLPSDCSRQRFRVGVQQPAMARSRYGTMVSGVLLLIRVPSMPRSMPLRWAPCIRTFPASLQAFWSVSSSRIEGGIPWPT